MSENQMLLALFIDGDNVSSKQIEEILDKAGAVGKVLIKRVYVNKSSMPQWETVINQYSLTPFWVSNNTTNKNSVDIALVVDAMALLYERPDLTGFCLVSSDSDFTVLARHIITKDKYVLGMGRPSTPEAFRNACTQFVNLNPVGSAATPVKKVEPPKAAVSKPPPVKKVEPPKTATTKKTPVKKAEPPQAVVTKKTPTQPPVKPVSKPVIQPIRSPQEIEVNRLRQAYELVAQDRNLPDKDGWVSLSLLRGALKTLYPDHNPLIYKGTKSSQLKKVIERMIQDYPNTIEIKTEGLDAQIRVLPGKTSRS